MADLRRFDLETLEFGAVRELLIEKLQTTLGRGEVEDLAPVEAAVANRRLQVVAELAVRGQADDQPPVGGAVEVRSWLGGFFADTHALTLRDLADLKRLLRAASRTRAWLVGRPGSPALNGLANDFPVVVADIAAELDDVIDDRAEVLDTASARLAQVRQQIQAAEAAVRAAVHRFLSDERMRRFLQSPEPTWRHGRPVFAVRFEQRHQVPGVLHDRSQSGATVFIEPEMVLAAANQLADAKADENHEIQVVLARVARGLRRCDEDIEGAVRALSRLDVAMAASRLCLEDGYHVAAVVEPGDAGRAVLRLRGALHPLLLRAAGGRREDLVPLDITLGEPFPMVVVTGPNTGGKTVALKTVGLLTAMASCGLPVPAEAGTALPAVDGVFADIGDEQGIEQSLSTFSSHVTRIARCLREATAGSLVLLDELGAGTDPEEGGALGEAVLEGVAARGCLAVVTTHLGRLKDFAYRNQGAENGAMAFDGASLRPLYRLDVGIPGASHALDIAGRVGLDAQLIDRARALLGERDDRLESVIEKVQQARREAEEQRRETQQLQRDASAAEADLDRKHREMDAQRAWLAEEADVVVGELIAAIHALGDAPLKQLAGAPRPFGEQARVLRDQLEAALAETSIHRRRMRFVGSLKKGHEVYVGRLKRRCVVRKVDKVRERVSIELGKMRIDVPYEDVSWIMPMDG